MKNKKLIIQYVFTSIILVLTISLFINACDQSQQGTTSPTSGSKYGGTLYRCIDIDARNLGDPATPPFRYTEFRMSAAALECLLRCDGNGSPAPMLATSWKIADDLKSITFTLQKDIKFHDGTPFNADAVKWNLDRYKDSSNTELKSISSIDVINDSSLRVNLANWDSTILNNFYYVPGLMISPTSFQKAGSTEKERVDWAMKNPVGTGAFKFVSWQRDVGIKFVKFEEYWQKGKPYLDSIEWVIIADPLSRLAALKRGEVDHLMAVDNKDAKDLEVEKKYVMDRCKLSGNLWAIAGDSKHNDSPFANIKVRQAIDYACDKKSLIDALTYGYGELSNQYAIPGTPDYNNDVKGYPYDPNKAKQLLAEAGYPDGFTTKLIGPNFSYYALPPTVVQEFLKKVGIKLEIQLVPAPAHTKALMDGWSKSLMILPCSLLLPDTTRNMITDISAQSVQTKSSILFPDDYGDALNKAKTAKDPNTKNKWTMEANKLLIDKYDLVNIFFSQKKLGFSSLKIHDTGIGVTNEMQWTPENTWKEK